MERKPPSKPSNLEIDRSGIEELRERQAADSREKSSRLAKFARARVENQEKMKQAVRESAERDLFWYHARWRALKSILLLLISYFLASALFDLVNFIEGAKLIWNWAEQSVSVALIYFVITVLRGKLSEEQKQELWRRGKLLFRPVLLVALTYLGCRGIWAISSTVVYRTKLGLHLNRPFLFFLLTFAAELGICWWLVQQRARAIALLREIDGTMDADDLPAATRDQLYFMQFVAEGMILNLLLMAAFHFTYGVNVPVALAWALIHSPLIFLFGFFPCFAYVFFRKYIQSYSN